MLNSATRRAWSRDPADPLRRATHIRTSRRRMIAPTESNNTRSISSNTRTERASGPNGGAPVRAANVAAPEMTAPMLSRMASFRPSPTRLAHCRIRAPFRVAAGCVSVAMFRDAVPDPVSARLREAGHNVALLHHLRPRTTGISSSRTFLRKVFRLSPSRAAARI